MQVDLNLTDDEGRAHDLVESHYISPVTQALLTTPSSALASAAEGFPSWDVLDAAHMLIASLIVDLVSDNERPNFLRKMDRVLRDRVKEIAVRQKPRLVV